MEQLKNKRPEQRQEAAEAMRNGGAVKARKRRLKAMSRKAALGAGALAMSFTLSAGTPAAQAAPAPDIQSAHATLASTSTTYNPNTYNLEGPIKRDLLNQNPHGNNGKLPARQKHSLTSEIRHLSTLGFKYLADNLGSKHPQNDTIAAIPAGLFILNRVRRRRRSSPSTKSSP